MQRLDQIAIGPGQQAVGQFDDAHLAAEFGIDGSHFEADVAAADDEQRSRARRPDSSAPVESMIRGVGRSKAGIFVGREPVARMQCSKVSRSVWPGAVEPVEPQRGRILEVAAGVDDLDVAALGQLLQPAGECVDHLLFAGAQLVDIDLRRLEVDAPAGHFLRLADHAGDVQQGLRRNAAAQQADAAQPRLGFDERDLASQIGGQKRRRIAAGATSQDNQLRFHIGKDLLYFGRSVWR